MTYALMLMSQAFHATFNDFEHVFWHDTYNIYAYAFLSFLNIETAQVFEILPHENEYPLSYLGVVETAGTLTMEGAKRSAVFVLIGLSCSPFY